MEDKILNEQNTNNSEYFVNNAFEIFDKMIDDISEKYNVDKDLVLYLLYAYANTRGR